jgi:general secretion pathway protein G
MRNDKNRQAFSLLELLAVIVIIALIAAMVATRVVSTIDDSKTNINTYNIATLQAAAERYYTVEGSWPSADLNELVPDYVPVAIPVQPTAPAKSYVIDGTTHIVSAAP